MRRIFERCLSLLPKGLAHRVELDVGRNAERLATTSIRVFVSSTFLDMQEERDALAASCFPALRTICAEHGVGFQEVDLRWGITAEQSEQGLAAQLCLREVDLCRPFFLAILGSRYGWVDPEAAKHLGADYPHLLPFADRSLTEVEIRHALSAHSRPLIFVRTTSAEEGVRSEHPLIQRLVDDLRGRGYAVNTYQTSADLTSQVEFCLTTAIRAVLPRKGEAATADQMAFKAMHSIAHFQRADLLQRLLKAVEDKRHVVLEGATGSGKSALMVALAGALHSRHGKPPIYCAVPAAGPNWHRAFLHIADAGFDEDDPYNALRKVFLRRKTSILIDDIEAYGNAVFGYGDDWLPPAPKSNVVVVATARPEVVERLCRAGFHRFSVPPLTHDERLGMATAILRTFGKALDSGQRVRLTAARGAATPGYIRAVCEELRHVGKFENVSGALDALLVAGGEQELFVSMLRRLQGSPGMTQKIVRAVFRWLLAARSGLSENEILSLLAPMTKTPMLVWSPVFGTVRPFLVRRGGFYSIGPSALAEAVRRVYVQDGEDLVEARMTLARHFLQDRNSDRSIDEVPWLLEMCGRFDVLAELLADGSWIARARRRDAVTLRALARHVLPEHVGALSAKWKELCKSERPLEEAIAALDLLAALGCFADVVAATSPDANPALAANAEAGLLHADSLAALSRASEALGVLMELHSNATPSREGSRRIAQVTERAGLLAAQGGDYLLSQRLLTQAVADYHSAGDELGRLHAEANLAFANLGRGEVVAALQHFTNLAGEARRRQDFVLLAAALGGTGAALRERGKGRAGLDALRKAEHLLLVQGDLPALVRCLVNQALCQLDNDNYDAADSTLERAQHLAEQAHVEALIVDVLERRIDLLQRIGLGSGARSSKLRDRLASVSATSSRNWPPPARTLAATAFHRPLQRPAHAARL